MKGLLPELGAYDMVCKFCQFRYIDDDSEFHLEQGDAYRGQGCNFFGSKPKSQTVMEGENCPEFKLDEQAELQYPLWEQRSFVLILLRDERWDVLENGENAELERLWQAWEKKFGWRCNYVDDETYEDWKARVEQEGDDS